MDPLERLRRTDKWFLAGGKGAIYAPPFPRALAAPGFWDECFLADIKLRRLFTVVFCEAGGRPVSLESRIRSWRPDRLDLEHRGAGRTIHETRCVLPCQAWVSSLSLVSGAPLDAFVWSLQDVSAPGHATPWSSLTACEVLDDSISFEAQTSWPEDLRPDRSATEKENIRSTCSAMRPPVTVCCRVGARAPRLGFQVGHAQTHDDSPIWETSILPERLRRGALAGEFRFHPELPGLLHMVQHYRLGPERPLEVVCAAGLAPGQAAENLSSALVGDPVEQSERAWTAYFASVPEFSCSDERLETAYWYRWYGLHLNTVDIVDLPRLGKPFVTEGVGFFRNFVTYSAQAHLREASWMQSPALAVGILDNLALCQREDGSIPGHNYSGRPSRDFYHADFGGPLVQLEALHPGSVGSRHIETLRRYAGYFEAARRTRHGNADVFDIFDQNETGQEYMSRYLFARGDAEEWSSFRVSGVDATVYLAALYGALSALEPAEDWGAARDRAFAGLATVCWDHAAKFFCDARSDGTRSPARPATGIYPYALNPLGPLADRLPNGDLLLGLPRWFLNPHEFWLPQGFPATAKSDATYSAAAEWKDIRLNCPWNGRSWPMTNSHFVDALANVARSLDPSLRRQAGEALLKAVHLLFHDDDPARPCCYEHFNPETGMPAVYRGYDDYMHSWVVDLVLRHAVGVQPRLGRAPVLDPLPLGLEITCSGIPCPEGLLDVQVKRGKAEAEVRAQ